MASTGKTAFIQVQQLPYCWLNVSFRKGKSMIADTPRYLYRYAHLTTKLMAEEILTTYTMKIHKTNMFGLVDRSI